MSRLVRNLKGTATLAVADGATRYPVILDNRVRTSKLIVRVRGTFNQTVAVGGAVRNGGDIAAVVQHALNANGEDVFGVARGSMLRFRAAMRAGQSIAVSTLPQSTALPVAAYPLESVYEINFADPTLIAPQETAFMESDPTSFLQLDSILNANAVASLCGAGGTQTLTGVTVQVEQVAAPAAGNSLPIFRPRYRELSQVVAGANPQDIMFIKTAQRLAEIIVSQEMTLADGGTVATQGIINSLRLIGDGVNANLIGPNLSPFASLFQSQKSRSGGNLSGYTGVTAVNSRFGLNLAEDGRLAATIVPARQYPNFRIEADDQPDAGGTTSRIVVGITELIRPQEENGWPVVTPDLPGWLIGGQ